MRGLKKEHQTLIFQANIYFLGCMNNEAWGTTQRQNLLLDIRFIYKKQEVEADDVYSVSALALPDKVNTHHRKLSYPRASRCQLN